MPCATVNGARVHYLIEGKGHPVLLLHAVGVDLTCWDAQAPAFAPCFQVVRVDLRGHGRSEVTPPPYTLQAFADDMHAFLHQLALAPAHVVGLSMGGMVAQVLALSYPADVSALVLADTNSTLPPEARAMIAERGEAALRGGMASVVEATLSRWFTPAFMGSAVVARCRQRLLADDVNAWAASWRAISQLDTHARLGDIRVPTLVVTGEADVSAPATRAHAIAAAIPGAVAHIVPGAPHMAPMERPELFTPVVLDFLQTVG